MLEEDLSLYRSPLTARITSGPGPGPFWSCDCACSRFAPCPARGVRRRVAFGFSAGEPRVHVGGG